MSARPSAGSRATSAGSSTTLAPQGRHSGLSNWHAVGPPRPWGGLAAHPALPVECCDSPRPGKPGPPCTPSCHPPPPRRVRKGSASAHPSASPAPHGAPSGLSAKWRQGVARSAATVFLGAQGGARTQTVLSKWSPVHQPVTQPCRPFSSPRRLWHIHPMATSVLTVVLTRCAKEGSPLGLQTCHPHHCSRW